MYQEPHETAELQRYQHLKSRHLLFSQWKNKESLYIRAYAANSYVQIRLYRNDGKLYRGV
jgi:hypothetical protein